MKLLKVLLGLLVKVFDIFVYQLTDSFVGHLARGIRLKSLLGEVEAPLHEGEQVDLEALLGVLAEKEVFNVSVYHVN
jgi:hypothetical protein